MDYNSRKSLLDAITDDCSQNIGICLSTGSSQIVCFEQTSPEDKGNDKKGGTAKGKAKAKSKK